MMFSVKTFKLCTIGLLSLSVIGCETKAGSGALIGGATGAVVGGLIGSKSHGRAGEGAAIGAAAGAIGGGLIGNGMDQNDKNKAEQRNYESDYDRRNKGQPRWQESSNGLTKSDVIGWTDQGVRDDIIIDRIERSGTVFRLSAADQNELRDRGVSEAVIRAMKDTARR